jgi:hypothetical protein
VRTFSPRNIDEALRGKIDGNSGELKIPRAGARFARFCALPVITAITSRDYTLLRLMAVRCKKTPKTWKNI